MKGRNTTVISVRLPDKVIASLAERANRKDLSIGDYLKEQIIRSVNAMGSVNAIPKYDKSIHKVGDVVMMLRGKQWVKSIVPELDADGQPMPEY